MILLDLEFLREADTRRDVAAALRKKVIDGEMTAGACRAVLTFIKAALGAVKSQAATALAINAAIRRALPVGLFFNPSVIDCFSDLAEASGAAQTRVLALARKVKTQHDLLVLITTLKIATRKFNRSLERPSL